MIEVRLRRLDSRQRRPECRRPRQWDAAHHRGKALDISGKISDHIGEGRWHDELRGRLGVQDAELRRLGEMFEFLLGPLAVLCDQAQTFSDQLDKLSDAIARSSGGCKTRA